MKPNKWIIGGLMAAALVASAATWENRAFSRGYMRQKLAYSQGVLEGLTLENFEQVTKNGIRIRNMKLTNLMYSVKNPLYMNHVTNYHRAIDRLLDASTDKDLAGATKAYQGVIQSCIECHRDYRTDQRKVPADVLKPKRSTTSKGTTKNTNL